MGHITRRLTYRTDSRRISLPAEFVSQHDLKAGSQLTVLAPLTDLRLLYPRHLWQAVEATLGILDCPLELRQLMAEATPVQAGSQSRLVLPPQVAFESQAPSLRLFWEIEAGVLVVRAEDGPTHVARTGESLTTDEAQVEDGINTDDARDESNATRGAPANPDFFTSALMPPSPVQDIPLERIHGFAPDLPPADYDRKLADEVAMEGMVRPVVLSGHTPYRVVDGFKRLRVAQAIEMDRVPAIVLGELSRKDINKLRYLLETTSDRWATARQLRAIKRLHEKGCTIDNLCHIFRKQKRTVQRYLRIAQMPDLVRAIETGEISMIEAERQIQKAGIL